MIGKVIEGRYAGAVVNKLPDKNVLFMFRVLCFPIVVFPWYKLLQTYTFLRFPARVLLKNIRALIILSQIHAINTNFVHHSFGVLFMIGFPQKSPYGKEIKI